MASMEEVLDAAKAKGMFMVGEDTFGELVKEYEATIREVDELCERVDDEAKPYESKYKARELLDAICNKLEATRTVATLEKRIETVEQADYRVGAIRVRLGSISYEVDEPHNSQTDLDLAAGYYFPKFMARVNELSGKEDEESETTSAKVTTKDIEELTVPDIDLPTLRSTTLHPCIVYIDALKCLNMMGILWAGRGRVRKAFLILKAAEKVYDTILQLPSAYLSESQRKDLESAFNHSLFYLAQAYGNIGNAAESSRCCHATLQRQYQQGLPDVKTSLDWAKNCAAMADFYISSRCYRRASMALLSSESVVKSVQSELQIENNSNSSSSSSNAIRCACEEQMADLNRRLLQLELLILKRAKDRHEAISNSLEYGLEWIEEDDIELVPDVTAEALRFDETSPLFQGIEVRPLPLLGVADISDFESARTVYLRAVQRLEQAKKYYVLDGFVTDHVNLLTDHSKLYHYLAAFETESKRKIAMENRRLEMLEPLLGKLSKSAFEALHKSIAYELGEANLFVLDCKLDKLRGRVGEGITFDERTMKKAEISKCNEYVRGAIAMFNHFIHFYLKPLDRDRYGASNSPFQTMSLAQLKDIQPAEPDISLITEEEIRPYLMAHFLIARAFSKVIGDPNSAPRERAQWLVTTLHRYQWLTKEARSITSRKNVELKEVFQAELAVCDDMIALLPSKIDRMYYQGESGLSL